MNTRLFIRIATAASALLAGPAFAQTAISASSTSATSTSSTTTSTSTSALVPLSGIVTGSPESVRFSGQASVSAKVVTDPDFGGQPAVVLTIDLGGVSGTGSTSGKKYVVANREILTRKLSASDAVEVGFPFRVSGAADASAQIGLASFALSFNVSTMKLTGATGSISTPR